MRPWHELEIWQDSSQGKRPGLHNFYIKKPYVINTLRSRDLFYSAKHNYNNNNKSFIYTEGPISDFRVITRAHLHNVRDFPQDQLESETNAR